MKKTVLLLINFFLFQFAYSQNIQVNGNIKSEEGETLPGAYSGAYPFTFRRSIRA